MSEIDPTTVRARERVGTLLNGRWRLDQLVGMGGMAAVYAATHRNSKRVAIKILHPELSVDDNARQRFLREGYAANQVGHRGAVAADDDGTTEDGVTFLVMELLEGETIEERSVRRGGTLEAREVLALMDQVLATLVAAHEKGIVHRDLKPENLFLTREGVVKVLDFGIARTRDTAGSSPSQTQGLMGTPSFMAPEQARGRWEDVDARTDLWAIGATLFTLLSGRFVHRAETANEVLVLAVTERAPSLAQVMPNIAPEVAELVDRALAYERELRFQSASEFRTALHAAHAAIAGDETPPSLAVPKPRANSVAQAGPLSVTTGRGVATSVLSGQTTGIVRVKRSAKTPLALGALAGVALMLLAGRGLVRAPERPPPLALATEAQTGRHAAASPLLAETSLAPSSTPNTARVTPEPVTVGETLPTTNRAPVDSSRKPAALLAQTHTIVARPAIALGLTTVKPRIAKPSADPFKKRH
jgi:eukaryotic-like serine/threonine-protein kinase